MNNMNIQKCKFALFGEQGMVPALFWGGSGCDFRQRLIRYAVGGILIVRKTKDEEVDLRSQGADVV